MNLLALDACNAGISPTVWQKSLYPVEYQPKISVIHEGINGELAKPDANAKLISPDMRVLTQADKRSLIYRLILEPYRGFHIFMRVF